MNPNGHCLPYKPVFAAAPSQLGLDQQIIRNQSFDGLSLHQVFPMPEVRIPFMTRSLLHPSDSSMLGFVGPSSHHKLDPGTSLSALGPDILNGPLGLSRSLMTSTLLSLQSFQKHMTPSSTVVEKGAAFTGTPLAIGSNEFTGPKATKRSKKVPSSPDEWDQLSSLSKVQTSVANNSPGKDCSIVSSPAVSSTTEAESEIGELKVKIGSLYAKLNEIQRKHETVEHSQSILTNLRRNSCSESNSGNRSHDSSLKSGNDSTESPCATSKNSDIENLKKISEYRIYESPNVSQTEVPLQYTGNAAVSEEVKAGELSPQMCSALENNGEFWATEPLSLQKSPNLSTSLQKTTTTIGVGADGGIILANSSRDLTKQQAKRCRNSKSNDHADFSSNSISGSENFDTGKESAFQLRNGSSQQEFDANLKMRLAFLAARRKIDAQCSSSALQKPEVSGMKDGMVTRVKRIQEFRDAICPPALSHTSGEVLQNQNTAYSGQGSPCANPYFFQDSHLLPTQLPPIQNSSDCSMLNLTQSEASGFAPPIQYEPVQFYPGIPQPLDGQSYLVNPNNQLLHPGQIQHLASSPQATAQFLRPAITTGPSLACHQRPCTFLNSSLTVGNGKSVLFANYPISNISQRIIHPAQRKTLHKKGAVVKQRRVQPSKYQKATARTFSTRNNVVHVPKPTRFTQIMQNEQIISRIKNPCYDASSPPINQQITETNRLNAAPMTPAPQENHELQQQSSNTWSIVTLSLPTMLHDSCNCFP